jgi:hypothetical protein
MARFFTLREAQALLPQIERLLRAAVEAKSQADEVDLEMQALAARIAMSGGIEIDPARVAARKVEKIRAYHRVHEAVEEIQGAGVLIKDLDSGLIDFPALLGEREVYLCWKLGEPRIEYWHSTDEGFAGRKPIETEFGDSGAPPSRPN